MHFLYLFFFIQCSLAVPMGGNALISSNHQRWPKQEYQETEQKLLKLFKPVYQKVEVVPYLGEKLDFGDLDLIAYDPHAQLPSLEFLKNHPDITSQESVVSEPGRMISFEHHGMQVDLSLFHNWNEFLNVKILNSYGGFGGYIGPALKALQVKWNDKGLHLLSSSKLIVPSQKSIFLTDNPIEIIKVLGLDYARWEKGFETKAEFFNYLTQSFVFDSPLLKERLQALIKTASPRDQRSLDFYKFAIENKPTKQVLDLPRFHQSLVDHFNKQAQVKALHIQVEQAAKFKKVFNGGKVQQVTGLKGPELGQFINFVQGNSGKDFREKVLALTDVNDFIRQEFSAFEAKKAMEKVAQGLAKVRI